MAKDLFLFLFETLKIAGIALLIVFPIRYFLFQPFLVWGQSMNPAFSDGDYLLVDEISYRFSKPQRGDVVVFKYPQNPTSRYIKRIIGLPGETVEIKDNALYIHRENGEVFKLDESEYLPSDAQTLPKKWPLDTQKLGKDEYFVLGDNREASSDSRVWGVLPREYIIGQVFLRAWPLGVFAKIEAPDY